MTDLAVGVPMFKRVERLSDLLNSVAKTKISSVYVADNGKMTAEKEELYNDEYPFNLTIFDIEYDSGLGNCRDTLVSKTNEDFLFFVDSDMRIPSNYDVLVEQLKSRPSLGGVGGIILDENQGRIRSTAGDLRIEDDIVHKVNGQPTSFEYVAGSPLAEFEYIQNAAVFRRECLDDYSWDDSYLIGREHLDFFLGHKLNTEWDFAVSPQVIFPHNPGGSDDYSGHRKSNERLEKSKKYFQNKWDVDGYSPSPCWIDTVQYYQSSSKINQIKRVYEEEGMRETINQSVSYGARQIKNLIGTRPR